MWQCVFKRVAVGLVGLAIASGAIAQDAPSKPITKQEILTDAAIVAVIIAASIAAYKAMGKPCACPEDTMRNGASCGNRSAYAKPGGFKPLCYATDITADMIKNYRTSKIVPGLR